MHLDMYFVAITTYIVWNAISFRTGAIGEEKKNRRNLYTFYRLKFILLV